MRHRRLANIYLVVVAGFFLAGQAQAEPLRQVFHPEWTATSRPTLQLRLQWQRFLLERDAAYRNLRKELTQFCSKERPHPDALADKNGILELPEREKRMVALDLRIKRLNRYIAVLQGAYAKNQYEQKVMRIGYIVSDALFTFGSFGLSKTLNIPWLQVVLPVSMKVTNQLVTDAQGAVQPPPFQLHLDDDMSRLLQVIQFKLNPGPFQSNACYLSSAKLQDRLGHRCHPDHPFVRTRHQQLGELWQKSQKLLQQHDLPPFWSGVFEFLTHRQEKVLQTQEFFNLASSALLRMQIEYLKKMRAVLHNDYQSWGCQQLRILQRNQKRAKRIAL